MTRIRFARVAAATFRCGTLALGLASAFTPSASGDRLPSLPRRSPPPDHPCALPDAAFEELHEADGVQVRILRPPNGAPVVRATTWVGATPLAAAAAVARVEGWTAWAPRVREAAGLGGAPRAFRLLVDAPWPFSDREYAVAPSYDGDSVRIVVFWESASDRLPPRLKGVVRLSHVRGGFSFEEESGRGSTRVVYSHESDLGGRLPRWAEDGSNRRGPVGVLRGLRDVLSRRVDSVAQRDAGATSTNRSPLSCRISTTIPST